MQDFNAQLQELRKRIDVIDEAILARPKTPALSRDYKKLWELLQGRPITTETKKTNPEFLLGIPCYVDYRGWSDRQGEPAYRDIAAAKNWDGQRIAIAARGIEYGGVGREFTFQNFSDDCQRMNLEFVDGLF